MLTVGSLFAGIGGIDLGLERTGHFKTHWFCERDPYCQRVLAKHWPDVPVYEDVANIGADTPAVDVIAAGFPCQPVSLAGRRKAQDDDRWLWPHVERCISVLRPRGVLLENVPGLITAGFDDVLSGLAACGYDAEWDCIPAAAVGAPHLRDRVFIIAAPMADAPQLRRHGVDDNPRDCSQSQPEAESRDGGWPSPMADANGAPWPPEGSAGEAVFGSRQVKRLRRRSGLLQNCEWPSPMADAGGEGSQRPGNGWAAANGACQNDIWATEPNVGRVANGVPKRVDRLRALGNAVVPQVAEYVGWQLVNMMGGTDG
jgi:DNA (cytosine-5)-methyltransferase 1